MARAQAALAPLELTPLAYETLICIEDGKGLSQQELSRQLKMYAPKMVGLIDCLEGRGLVERRVSPSDRRRNTLHLTPSGAALLKQASVIAAKLEADLFADYRDEEKEHLRALVERLEATESADTTG
jgi:DNA-binding MarR family transcriptional regulator